MSVLLKFHFCYGDLSGVVAVWTNDNTVHSTFSMLIPIHKLSRPPYQLVAANKVMC